MHGHRLTFGSAACWLQVRAARRLAQGRAKPIDWLVCDLYGLQAEEEHEGHNDEADDSDEEREHLRRQVRRCSNAVMLGCVRCARMCF